MGKKILILTMGSRGDVEPFLALGPALQREGHQVTIGTHAAFRSRIEQSGLSYAPVAGDPQAMIESEAGQRWLRSGLNPWEFLRGFVILTRPFLRQALEDSQKAAQQADAIIWTQLSFAGYHLARQLDLPGVMVGLQPLTPTAQFAPAGAARDMPLGALNYFSHWLSNQLLWLPFRKIVNRWLERDLGQQPYGFLSPFFRFQRERHLTLYAYSPALVPAPSDWGDHIHVTGFFYRQLPERWHPPASLRRFLAAGPQPIYIGFGSMALADPVARSRIIRSALERLDLRAIVLDDQQAGETGPIDSRVYLTGAVPHAWLLPRVRAAVHHGGAGTTAAALRAGIAQIVVPHFADQFFWAGRVARAGVGPPPIPRDNFGSDTLADRLATVLGNPGWAASAQALGERIRAEDGVGEAVALISDRLRFPGFAPPAEPGYE